jgi:DNA-binding NarL/FixJ family response regulator
MIKILIADDQTLMRDGLKTILDLEEDMEVIALCENGKSAYEMCKTAKPDVVLMDIRMPVMNGVESVKLIKKEMPHIVVIMLTTFDDEEYIIDALTYGANGYLLKEIKADKLLEAIRDSLNGGLMIPSVIAAKLAARLSRSMEPQVQDIIPTKLPLSDREMEIALLMAKGLTNKQISAQLYITEGTVKNYISSIYDKIEISDRTQAVLFLKKELHIK